MINESDPKIARRYEASVLVRARRGENLLSHSVHILLKRSVLPVNLFCQVLERSPQPGSRSTIFNAPDSTSVSSSCSSLPPSVSPSNASPSFSEFFFVPAASSAKAAKAAICKSLLFSGSCAGEYAGNLFRSRIFFKVSKFTKSIKSGHSLLQLISPTKFLQNGISFSFTVPLSS